MNARHASGLLALPLILALAGCAAMTPPVDVTRFHTLDAAPLASGTRYAIATTTGRDPGFDAAVEREMQRVGLVPASPGESAPLAVRIGLERTIIDPPPRSSPVSIGVGGSTGSYGSGVGVGIGINLSGAPKPRVRMQLSVRIDDAATGQSRWEGRAETEMPTNAPAAAGDLAAAKLASALFGGFPGASGATISVP
jgi:hypothetical protein